MTLEIMKAKTLRHNVERTWHRSLTHLDRSRYKYQCHLCNRMMTKAKLKYLAEVISENSVNPRRLWNSINNILHRIPPVKFTSVKSLCDHFSKYCVDKIETIRSKFPDKVQNIPPVQKTEIRSKWTFLKVRQKMKLWSLFWAHCQNHVIWTPFLQACWKIVLPY